MVAHTLRQHMTTAERHLWSHLSSNQLGVRFIRQGLIGNGYASFVCLSKKIAIEIDSSAVISERSKAPRVTASGPDGFRILFFWDIDVLSRTDKVIDAIIDALDHRIAINSNGLSEPEWPDISW